jgi:hypothetical protein
MCVCWFPQWTAVGDSRWSDRSIDLCFSTPRARFPRTRLRSRAPVVISTLPVVRTTDWACDWGRAMSQRVSLVEAGRSPQASAATRGPSVHEMGAHTARACAAFQPVCTRDKERYIARLSLCASGPPCPVRRAHGWWMEKRDNLLPQHRQLSHRLLARTQGAHDKLRRTRVDVLVDPLGNVRGRPDGTDRGQGHIRPRWQRRGHGRGALRPA